MSAIVEKNDYTPRVHHGENFHFNAGDSVGKRTAEFNSEQGEPLASFVRWLRPLDEQVVLNKDGSLMACFDFSGLDLDSASNGEVNQVRDQLLYALEQMQEHSLVLSWQVRRRETKRYPDAVFPDPVSQRMDDAQRAAFMKNTQYINRHSVSLCMYPSGNSARVLAKLQRVQEQSGGLPQLLKALFSGLKSATLGEDDFPFEDESEIAQSLEQFQKIVDTLLAATLTVGLKLLRGNELGGLLELASSPTSAIDQLADLPNSEAYMDTCMPVADIDNSFRDMLHFTHNGREAWAKCFSIDLRKRETLQMDMLDKLMAAPFEFTLSHVYKFLPRSKAERTISEVEKYHSSRRYSLKSMLVAGLKGGDLSGVPVNEVRQEATDEAKSIRDRVSTGKLGLGMYYGVVMVQARDVEGCHVAGEQCEEILQGARLLPRQEGLHKLSSFAATIPGSHEEVARWQKIMTANFVDLCPVRTVAKGHFENQYLTEQMGMPCPALLALPTKHRTPFYFTGYVQDLGHLLLIGPSATGKTTFAVLGWTAFRKYSGSRVMVFDKNYSCRPSICLQGGKYIDLNPEKQSEVNRHTMSPYAALLKTTSQTHIAFCASWTELLVKMRGYSPTAVDRIDLERALKETQKLGQTNPSMLRLQTLLAQLDNTTEFAKALQPWTGDAVYGKYFDNDEDHFDLDSLVGIEMGSILGDEQLAAPFMSYAFYRIASQLRDMGANPEHPIPTLIYIPETWYFIRQPAFAAELEEWLVTLRKLGGVVWFDTQSPDKLVESPIFSAFRDNIATMVFTPNRKALTESLGGMYRKEFNLAEHEIQYIANGIPKRDYFISQSSLSRRISLSLGKEVMSCIRSDTRAQQLLEKLQGQPDWENRFIQELSNEK